MHPHPRGYTLLKKKTHTNAVEKNENYIYHRAGNLSDGDRDRVHDEGFQAGPKTNK